MLKNIEMNIIEKMLKEKCENEMLKLDELS
jgi:hypothetical protein